MLRMFTFCSDLTSLCHYTRLYGAQILLLTVLSAITIYRRELSVNHTYVDEPEKKESLVTDQEDKPVGGFNAEFADELLEGAGNTFSGQSLLAFLANIVAYLGNEDDATREEQTFKWNDCDEMFEQAGNFCSGSIVKRVFVNHDQDAMPTLTKQITWEDCSDDLLEGAGNFCSGSVWTFLFLKSLQADVVARVIEADDAFTQGLAPDVQVQILSFLHPRDITIFSCVSRSCRSVTDHGETSSALWRSLWKRDYAWILESWSVGRQALLRSSLPDNFQFSKTFYFEFGASFLNYVLAGHNTAESCLVGLHGDIYNLTDFLSSHPGSPDTLLVNAGRDATKYFEDMRHTLGARNVAKTLCILVDLACVPNKCGVHPTQSISLETHLDVPPTRTKDSLPFLLKAHRRPFVLHSIRSKLDGVEQQFMKTVVCKYFGNRDVLNGVNLYYDPFYRIWKGWYTSTSFETVYLESI